MRNDFLAHHGILGQKWGIRRYQNSDGSLTEAGRERYGKEIKKKLDAGDTKGAVDTLRKIKGVNKFRENNEASIRLRDARLAKETYGRKVNAEANKRAREAVGGKTFGELLESNPALVPVYMSAGKKYAESKEVVDKMSKLMTKLDKAEREYEKEGRDYINKLFGEAANIEIDNPTAVKYNMKTGKIEKQTIGDAMGYELYRLSGGRPRSR